MQASLQRGDASGYLCIGESRKSGLGVSGSLPMEQRASGMKDPQWISHFSKPAILPKRIYLLKIHFFL